MGTQQQQRHRRRWRLWLKFKGECSYCKGRTLYDKPEAPNGATIDHVESRIKFGKGRDKNKIVLSCRKCNLEKNRLEIQEMRARIGTEPETFRLYVP